MVRKSRHSLRRYSPSHEPLAIGEGEKTLGGIGPNRMDSRLAKWVSSSTQAAGIAQLYVRLPRQRRSWSRPPRTDRQENRVAPGRLVANCSDLPCVETWAKILDDKPPTWICKRCGISEDLSPKKMPTKC